MKSKEDIIFEDLQEDEIDIRALVMTYLRHWKWFLLCLGITFSYAFFYLKYQVVPQYSVTSKVLLLERKEGNVDALSVLKDLQVLDKGGGYANDELAVIKSRRLMIEVIKELQYNIVFYTNGWIRKNLEVLAENIPFEVDFLVEDTVLYESSARFRVSPKSSKVFEFEDLRTNQISDLRFGEVHKISSGEVRISWKDKQVFNSSDKRNYEVQLRPLLSVADGYRGRLNIKGEKNSFVISLSLVDPIKKKAKNIVDRLVDQYIQDAFEEKSLRGEATKDFLNERLEIITNDLNSLDKRVQNFKQNNKLTDIEAEAALFLTDASVTTKKVLNLETQKSLVELVKSYLQTRPFELLPINLGLEDSNLNPLISRYNELVLEREYISKSATEENPVIEDLEAEISQIKESLRQSLQKMSASIDLNLSNIREQEKSINRKISKLPGKEREFKDIIRQQQIVEQLYLYLLQRREETAISTVIVPKKLKIIDRAFGSNHSVSPNKRRVYLSSILFGLLIPLGVIYLKNLIDQRLKSLSDIEKITRIPNVGIIPKSKIDRVISKDDNSAFAEAFRILRTNTNFFVSKGISESKVIYITSSIPGEGKTFVSCNLASVFALQSKKVLLIGADLRKPKISKYFNSPKDKGLSNFLVGEETDFGKLITSIPEYNIDILNSGPIPPNPTELIGNGNLTKLMDDLKDKYDYIIVDTAPVTPVADTLLIQELADVIVYIVRMNFTDKNMFHYLNKLTSEKKLENVALLVNDVEAKSGYGYSRYGYTTYGYNVETKSKIQELINKVKSIFRG